MNGLAKAAAALLLSKLSSSDEPRSGWVRFLQCALLIAVGLVSFELAWHYPSPRHDSSWREKDWLIWYNSHQLYQRDPEELSPSQFEKLQKWCRCSRLVHQYYQTGMNCLTDDDCELVVATLGKMCPNLHEHASLQPVYEACRRRLSDAPAGDWYATKTTQEQP